LYYSTVNLHESENNRIGAFFVQSLSTNRVFNVDVPAATGGDSVIVEFTTSSAGLQGYQPFFVGFQSDKVADLGPVEISYLSGNTVGLVESSSGGAYPLTTGEKFELLVWDDNSSTVQTVSPNTHLEWQLGYFRKDALASGNGVIFPGTAVYPMPITVYFQDDKDTASARIWELGAPNLYSISYVVIEADDYTPPDQFNHYHALALSSVNSAQSQAIPTFRPELANIQCHPYSFGRILTNLPDALTSTFCVQTEVQGVVEIAMTLFPLGDDSVDTVILCDILDKDGNSIFPVPLEAPFQSPGFTPTYSLTPTIRESRALIGVYAAEGQWGMRDALPQSDIQKGTQFVFQFPSALFETVGAGGVGVYTIRIESGRGYWVIAYSARLI
tara:strand:- start:90 stop:1247 length:1158 start_codon:yes stop_codon:yes gene_type:complete